MKLFRLSCLLILTTLLLNSCQRSSDFNAEIPQINTPGEYKLFTPAYYRDSPDGKSIQVRFFESPRIFDLPKTNTDFEQIKKMLDEKVSS